jgi:hypothetical protein
MLTTIDLNNESPFKTDKVRDVRPQRMLSPEFELLEIPASKQLPEAHLGVGEGLTHSSGSIASC